MIKKVKKGDQVVVLIGKDKGKKGKVTQILSKKDQVVVGGINIVKKHIKAKGRDQPGGIIDLEKPLNVSRVAVFCSKCQKPTRVGWSIDKSGAKHRICRRCKSLLEKKGN
ncbi:50S ribosomal protein L24 [Candidatus Shapirobacteria bacterium]|nr:50S ribosomal protein L24 [Candidatus Shapirobacteria bacterium]